MPIMPDHWIRHMAAEHGMIEPFVESQRREGVISYGLSSFGYDARVADEFKVFTNVYNTVVDPKNFDPRSFVDIKADVCIIPPNSFALARTIEYFRIPRDILTVCQSGMTTLVDRLRDGLSPVVLDDLHFTHGTAHLVDDNQDGIADEIVGTWEAETTVGTGMHASEIAFTAKD